MDKEGVHNECIKVVEQKIETAQKLMQSAQQSANSETKSSAGDKYETGRAMAQQERDKAAAQLSQAIQMKNGLSKIYTSKTTGVVQIGSLVSTNNGTFYISISLGQIMIEGSTVFAISANSPIGAALIGKEVGEMVSFNGKTYEVNSIH